NGGNDTFSGSDFMQGFGGHDVFYVPDSIAHVIEPVANSAVVMSAYSYSLFDHDYNVTHLVLTGSGNLTGTGNWGNDVLSANSGDDLLNGNGGSDTFVTGSGNDTLIGSANGASLAVFSDSFASHHFSGT